MAELGSYDDAHEEGYFEVLPTPPALIAGLALLQEAQALSRRLPPDMAQTVGIEVLIADVESRVAKIGIATAGLSEKLIKEKIASTRVRPESSGFGSPRKHLDDAVKSEPLGLGSVGIASISELDSVVGTDGKPFWRAQEYGSDHLVGRTIFGLFQPGGVPAEGGMFRRHPIFETGNPEGQPMTIRRPIPARHFLRTGAAEATAYREEEFAAVQATAIDLMRAIRVSLEVL